MATLANLSFDDEIQGDTRLATCLRLLPLPLVLWKHVLLFVNPYLLQSWLNFQDSSFPAFAVNLQDSSLPAFAVSGC